MSNPEPRPLTLLESLQSSRDAGSVQYFLTQLEIKAQQRLKELQVEHEDRARREVLEQWAPKLRELNAAIAKYGKLPELEEALCWIESQVNPSSTPPTPPQPEPPKPDEKLFPIRLSTPEEVAADLAKTMAPVATPPLEFVETDGDEPVIEELDVPPGIVPHPHRDPLLADAALPTDDPDDLNAWLTDQQDWAKAQIDKPCTGRHARIDSASELFSELSKRVLSLCLISEYYAGLVEDERTLTFTFGSLSAVVRNRLPDRQVYGLKQSEQADWRALLVKHLDYEREKEQREQEEWEAEQAAQASDAENKHVCQAVLGLLAKQGQSLSASLFQDAVRDYLRHKGDVGLPEFLEAVGPRADLLGGPFFRSVRRKLSKGHTTPTDAAPKSPKETEELDNDSAEDKHAPEVELWRNRLVNKACLLVGPYPDEARTIKLKAFFGFNELVWPAMSRASLLPSGYEQQVRSRRYDLVVLITSAIRHSNQNAMKAACSKSNVPLVLARKISLVQIARAMTAARLQL